MGSRCWHCRECGFTYDEDRGWPADGLAPGTPWEDIPEHWLCPGCGVYADFSQGKSGARQGGRVPGGPRRPYSSP